MIERRKRVLFGLAALAIPLLIAPPAFAQKSELYLSGKAQHGQDLAVGGYDTVAYHTQKAAVPGTAEHVATWKGATWRFATRENRDLFIASPEKYAPQYGGYCAFAVASGGKSPGDPKVWSVVDGKLYLNLSKGVQSLWDKDRPGFISKADQRWPQLIK